MKIIVTDEGEIAREIAKDLPGEVLVTDSPYRVLQERPDIVIHTYEVPYQEANWDRARAWNVNTWLAINIGKAGHKVGALNVYLSSSMIFNGRRGFYGETSTPDPLNYYGVTKLAGEIGIASIGNYLVLRLGFPFSLSYRGLLYNHLRSLVLRGRAVCNRNFYLSIISTRGIGRVVSLLLKKGATGVINVGNRVSECEVVEEMTKYFPGQVVEKDGKHFDFSLDDWLLRSFGIKLSPRNELREPFAGGISYNEGENTVVT
ncbi:MULTISPECIES: sugar nucleotide-binding protein [Metallosphaera]|uniref:sugar nucleotide-binding protein n=1 Tax=Metallosphaera TaxID=41980 RepID=UPI001F051BAF|nr:sugar nucleotide-binding protein [Metallosphaera sedula]MCH1771733.1 sugar nucleotide-binding protein [Metallosphaera sedula]MCP6728331.1 sugar nucleotide-binding protein [Metallosphaera sedula]